MSFLEINNVRIAGISAGVPKEIHRLEHEGKLSDDYDSNEYSKSTGVYQRHYSDSLTTSDLCFHAANKLLQDLNWDKSSVDAIILVTQTGDYICPATACILQDRLGLNKECYAMDINLGCSGWVYGLSVVAGLLSNVGMKRALLLAGDARFWHNEKTDPLFGSAGTVTALEWKERESFKFHFGTDGSGWNALWVPDGGSRNPITSKSMEYENIDGKFMTRLESRMLGMDVFSFGITTVPKSVKKSLENYSLSFDNIDYFVFHQANKLMIDTIIKKLKLNNEKTPLCIDEFGNTSSASIPLTIVTRLNNGKSNNKTILCCGFGIGLSWGTVILKLDNEVIISNIVEVAN